MRWLVADRHGMHALVDALDLSTLTRMHEPSVTAGSVARSVGGNDMVWRVHDCASAAGTIRAHRPGAAAQPLHRPAATVASPNRPGRGCTWW